MPDYRENKDKDNVVVGQGFVKKRSSLNIFSGHKYQPLVAITIILVLSSSLLLTHVVNIDSHKPRDTTPATHVIKKTVSSSNISANTPSEAGTPTSSSSPNKPTQGSSAPKSHSGAVTSTNNSNSVASSTPSSGNNNQSGGGSITPSVALGIAVDDSNESNNDEIADYVSAVGANPVSVQWYQSWTEPLYYSSQESSVTAHHYIPVISWTSDSTPLTSISDGDENSTIDAAASLAKAWPGTLYIRFDYEMNVSSSEWDPSNLNETPADFVAAWQYIVNRFSADGVTNVQWIWSPNVDCNGSCPFDSYYPGKSYVNMVGLDGYNYASLDNVSWESFSQLFQSSYNDLVALAPGMPVDIAETASAEANTSEAAAGDSKAAWIQQIASYIPANMPKVVALTWWSADADQSEFEVNSSSSSLSSWLDNVVNNPVFQATSL